VVHWIDASKSVIPYFRVKRTAIVTYHSGREGSPGSRAKVRQNAVAHYSLDITLGSLHTKVNTKGNSTALEGLRNQAQVGNA
jgi:hypothetical protein